MRQFFLLFILFSLCAMASAQSSNRIKGRVVDEKGNALAYANVYWKGESSGTTTNSEGQFSIKYPGDGAILAVRYIGYEYYADTLRGGQQDSLLIVLKPTQVSISEVVVTGDEDPAYRIIREAIAKRKFHLNQVEQFSCEAYIKGTIRLNDIPEKPPAIIPKALAPDTNDLGLLFLTESESRYHFRQPDKKKEEMIASRVAGFSQGYSWNRASEMEINLYNNAVYNESYSEREIISPISDRAMFFYKYKLEGSFYELGAMIHKIKVIPKRPADPVFSGYIYIVDGEWAIHSYELNLNRQNGLQFADSLFLGRNYYPELDSLWMPLSNHVKARYTIFGYDVTERYLCYYTQYNLYPEFKKGFFGPAVFEVEGEARDRDSTYWDSARVVLLTAEETDIYVEYDSMEALMNSPAYMDSLDRQLNKPKPLALLLTGYTFAKRYNRIFLVFDPVISMINYNTVEGANLSLGTRISKWSEEYKTGFYLNTDFKYGFGNKQFNAKAFLGARLSRKHFESIGIGGGRYSYQYNSDQPIGPFINTVHTLLAGKNHMKLYDARFGTIKYQRELFNGFFFHADFTYANRRPLQNVTDFSFKKEKNREMTSNNPQDPDDDAPAFEEHNAAYLLLKVTYRPGQKYELYPHKKELLGSKWPTFSLTYKKGLEFMGSKVNYDWMEFGIGDSRRLGLFGESEYDVFAGGFINNISTEFIDYKHFMGNQAYLLPLMTGNNAFGEVDRSPKRWFEALPYYEYSTNRYWVEAHYMHHFKGFIFNKIPGVRKLKFQMLAGVSVLYTPDQGTYVELVTGIENILRVLRFDLITSWADNRKPNLTYRIGIDLDFR
jgi:hypothetical protein